MEIEESTIIQISTSIRMIYYIFNDHKVQKSYHFFLDLSHKLSYKDSNLAWGYSYLVHDRNLTNYRRKIKREYFTEKINKCISKNDCRIT